jgi:hypothetical protein
VKALKHGRALLSLIPLAFVLASSAPGCGGGGSPTDFERFAGGERLKTPDEVLKEANAKFPPAPKSGKVKSGVMTPDDVLREAMAKSRAAGKKAAQ